MPLYRHLFYTLFVFLKSFEGGFYYQTDDYRALEVACVIGLLELLNVMSLFSSVVVGKAIVLPLIFFIGLNYLIFCHKNRYKAIVARFKSEKMKSAYKAIAIVYIIVTLIAFGFTR